MKIISPGHDGYKPVFKNKLIEICPYCSTRTPTNEVLLNKSIVDLKKVFWVCPLCNFRKRERGGK